MVCVVLLRAISVFFNHVILMLHFLYSTIWPHYMYTCTLNSVISNSSLSQTDHFSLGMLLRSFTIMVSRTIFHFPWELRQWGSVVKYIIQWYQTYYRGTGLVDLTSPSGLAQEFCNKDKFLFNLSINCSGSERWFLFTCIYTVHVHVVEATKDYTLEWSSCLLDKQNKKSIYRSHIKSVVQGSH